MMCHSDHTHYIDVFFFAGTAVSDHQIFYYQKEDEAVQMFQRGVNKYKSYKIAILINLRDKEHQLIKSELLNYKQPDQRKK